MFQNYLGNPVYYNVIFLIVMNVLDSKMFFFLLKLVLKIFVVYMICCYPKEKISIYLPDLVDW